MKPWYEINAKTDKEADILIYEQIGTDPWTGEGIGAKQFIMELNALKVARINLHINSPGGNVFEGNTIYNALKAHKAKKHVKIDGLAASIASVIAMAGDTIEMPENAMMMIHKASGLTFGNADDMLKMATALEKVDDGIVSTYHGRGKLDRKRIADLMGAETWITAAEAVEYGLADTITEKQTLQNCFNGNLMGRFKNVPDQYKQAAQPVNNAKETKPMEITMAFLNEKHPDLVDQIKTEATEAALEQGRAEGRTQGAEKERDRIRAVEAQLIPGHEDLIAQLKFDGETTGEQAAVKVLQAEKTLRASVRQNMADDAPAPVPHASAPEAKSPKTPQEKWDTDESLRAEFADFDTWQAYENAMAKGRVKLLTGRK